MKKRIHLKKKIKLKKINILIIMVIIIVISVIMFLNIVGNKMMPILFETSETEINRFSTVVINKAINQVIEDKINVDNIFSIIKNEKGEIQTIDFNPIIVNQVLNTATTVVEENIKYLQEGNIDKLKMYGYGESRLKKLKRGIITEIPLGVVFKNALTANVGPKIPIKLQYLGDINSNIKTKVTPYGINNAMVELGVHLEVTAQIILPLLTKKTTLEYTIPLAIKIIQGNIPSYYGGSLSKDSNIFSIPLD